MKSSDKNKNAAKHDTALTLEQLLATVLKHLNDDGSFTVLLPYHRVEECILSAEKIGLYLNKKVLVKQTEKHDYFRGILFFSKEQLNFTEEEIAIKTANDKYSMRFAELLKDYYLYL